MRRALTGQRSDDADEHDPIEAVRAVVWALRAAVMRRPAPTIH